MLCEEDSTHHCWLGRQEKEARSQRIEAASSSCKGEEADCSLEPPERKEALQTFRF